MDGTACQNVTEIVLGTVNVWPKEEFSTEAHKGNNDFPGFDHPVCSRQIEPSESNPQLLLRRICLRLGFLEIQVRLVIGMLGALLFGKQTFNRQQLHARIFFLVRAFVKARARGVLDHSLGAIVLKGSVLK
jgi:hypothetical protein